MSPFEVRVETMSGRVFAVNVDAVNRYGAVMLALQALPVQRSEDVQTVHVARGQA